MNQGGLQVSDAPPQLATSLSIIPHQMNQGGLQPITYTSIAAPNFYIWLNRCADIG